MTKTLPNRIRHVYWVVTWPATPVCRLTHQVSLPTILPSNTTMAGTYATEGALVILAHLSTEMSTISRTLFAHSLKFAKGSGTKTMEATKRRRTHVDIEQQQQNKQKTNKQKTNKTNRQTKTTTTTTRGKIEEKKE